MWPYDGPMDYSWHRNDNNELFFGDGNGWRPIERARSLSVGDCFTRHDLWRAWHSIYTLHRPQPSIWIRELQRGNIDVLVALILGHLPSLTKLVLGFGYLHHAQFIPAIFRHKLMERFIQTKEPYLKSLKTVELALDTPQYAVSYWSDLDLLRPFFFVSTIEKFHAGLVEPWLFAWPGTRPICPSMTTLVLCRSGIEEDTLNQILSATPALKHLTYDHQRNTDWTYELPEPANAYQIRCWRLNVALSQVKKTLQTLAIRIKFYAHEHQLGVPDVYNYDGPSGVAGRLTILKDMPQLQRLEIPWEVLFGWDIAIPTSWSDSLPPSLQEICLRDDSCIVAGYEWIEDVTFDRAVQLLDCYPESFMKLKRVDLAHVFDYNYRMGRLNKHDERLRAMFNSEGIGFDSILEQEGLE
ncbi:hypothetical protein BDV96DRAFT_571155, partial [Lophiotrema nucula]